MNESVSVLRFHNFTIDEMIYKRNDEFFQNDREIELDLEKFHLKVFMIKFPTIKNIP